MLSRVCANITIASVSDLREIPIQRALDELWGPSPILMTLFDQVPARFFSDRSSSYHAAADSGDLTEGIEKERLVGKVDVGLEVSQGRRRAFIPRFANTEQSCLWGL